MTTTEIVDGTITIADIAPAAAAAFGNTSLELSGKSLKLTDGFNTLSTDLSSLEAAARTAIDSLPVTISQPGSYYLAGSLTGAPGMNGITIESGDVTLNLNGFSLAGVSGSLNAITVSSSLERIRINNGIIQGWGGDGISAANGTTCQFENLIISANTGSGISVGDRSSVSHCMLDGNGEDGINVVGERNIVSDNTIQSNVNQGIRVSGNGNVVRDNKTIGNGIGFEVIGTGNLIANNYTIGNGSGANSNQLLTAGTNQYDLLISDIPETLNQPCNARLTGNVINTTANADGITIDQNNITLDLGGFTIFGTGGGGTATNGVPLELAPYFDSPIGSDDGIVVLGDQDHITVRNGSVVAWGGDGMNMLNADHSRFEDLHVGYNNGDGLVTDFNCLILDCTAVANGLDGLEGDDGTVIKNSTASENGDNGIQASEGCSVLHCNAFNNDSDGIDVAAGSTVIGCSSSDNGMFGFDIALGGSVVDCTAYDNMNTGFDLASSCIMDRCTSSLNNGHGVRSFANSRITNSKFHENDWDGIRISSTDCIVEGNTVTDNDFFGIVVTSSGCLVIGNRAAGNAGFLPTVPAPTNSPNGYPSSPTTPSPQGSGEYWIATTSAYGPVVNVTGVGSITGTGNANHPHANFSY